MKKILFLLPFLISINILADDGFGYPQGDTSSLSKRINQKVDTSQTINGINYGKGNIILTYSIIASIPDSIKKVVNQTFTKVINLTYKEIYYLNWTCNDTATIYPILATALKGSCAYGVIIADGTHTPTLSGITLWPFSDSFDPTASAQNAFQIKKFSNGIIYIVWKKLN